MLKLHKYYPGRELEDFEVRTVDKILQRQLGDKYTEDTTNVPIPSNLPTKEDIYPAAIRRYQNTLQKLVSLKDIKITQKPSDVVTEAGWHERIDGQWVAIVLPPANSLFVLDIETYQVDSEVWKPFCVTAWDCETGVWYQWLYNDDKPESLYPFSDGNMIVGHNIGYDRSYMANEYRLTSKNVYVDTMSCWITVRGICNQQKFAFHMDYKPEWTSETEGGASLRDVYRFYYGKDIDKSTRDKGVTMGFDWMSDNVEEVLKYNFDDVIHTAQITAPLLTEWLDSIPSDISRIAFLLKSQYILPMNEDSREWYENTEAQYQSELETANEIVITAADSFYGTWESCQHPQKDYWDMTPAKTGINKGKPKYIRDLFTSKGKLKKVSLSANITPVLLGLKYSEKFVDGVYIDHEYLYLAPWSKDEKKKCWRTKSCELPHDSEGYKEPCSSLFVKNHAKTIFDNGQIISEGSSGKEIIDLLVRTSTWKSMRKRTNQVTANIHRGFSVVAGAQTGTVTRRYTHPYWMVLPNPKGKKLGTEVKAKVKAREGYCLTIKDFEGQEARLSALVSTIGFGIPGGNAYSYTLALGDKAKKTDIHNIIAKQLGFSRDVAKTAFYGMAFFIGVTGLTTLFTINRVENPREKAIDMRTWLMGKKEGSTYSGGLASDYYNYIAVECSKPQPVTPVLKAKMSRSLAGNKDFSTTRGNWMIQSSGVDCLDLLLVAMDELYYREGWTKKDASIVLSIHDEVWSHIRTELTPRGLLLDQYAHFLCWDYIHEAVGMCGLPQMYMWFPDINVDKYGRKECFIDCKTPSNPDGYPIYNHSDIQTKEEITIGSYNMVDILEMNK